MSQHQPILFVPHGAPTFALHPGAAGAALAQASSELNQPRAIVMVSAHWDTEYPTVGCAEALETIHDYWGFPAELYDMRYPARGDLAVAEAVRRLLRQAGFQPGLDNGRGLDHGAWIPLRLMFPKAGIPVVPLSIQSHLGTEHHYRLGQALASLAKDNILIVASGNITHNLRDFQMAYRSGSGSPDYVAGFADWIWERMVAGDTPSLLDYRKRAPDAARAHPGEDHILPLHVALGAAGPGYRAERLYSGIENRVLAMDGYCFRQGQSGGLGNHEPEHAY